MRLRRKTNLFSEIHFKNIQGIVALYVALNALRSQSFLAQLVCAIVADNQYKMDSIQIVVLSLCYSPLCTRNVLHMQSSTISKIGDCSLDLQSSVHPSPGQVWSIQIQLNNPLDAACSFILSD